MGELQITREKLEEVQQKLTQYLLDSGYEGTLEDGTGAYDIVVKGNALITMYLNEQFEKTRGYLSLQEAEKFKDILGPEYDDAIDSILSNWFVSRKPGTKTRALVRLWFSRPLGLLTFSEGEEIVTIDDFSFSIVRDYTFTSENFTSSIQPEKFLEEFYVDIEVEALEDGSTVISTSSTVSIDFSDPYYLRSEVQEVLSLGEDEEASEDFINRTKYAATTRELITFNAIRTVLQEEFRDLSRIYIAGYGDSEQHRDVVEFDKLSIHVGNKADLYINGNHKYATRTYTADSEGRVTLDEDVITHVFKVLESGTSTEISFNISVDVDSNYLWCSNFVEVFLDLGSSYADQEVDVTLLYTNLVNTVSNYVHSKTNRVVCYSPVVKSLFPVVLHFDLEIDFTEGGLSDYETRIKSEVVNYIYNLEHGQPYIESKLIDTLHQEIPNIKRIKTPINCEYEFIKPESLKLAQGSFDNYLDAVKLDVDQEQVTNNTIEFYTNSDLIQCTHMNSE